MIVATPDPDVVEEEWGRSMTVVIEFSSVEYARAWYTDAANEAVKPIRHEASEYANAVLCPEFSPDGLAD